MWQRVYLEASNCECECDKPSDVGEYLDYENCKCMRILVEKLIEECIKTVKEVKHFENNHKCSSDTLHFVLFSILFTINVGIGTYIFFCIAT